MAFKRSDWNGLIEQINARIDLHLCGKYPSYLPLAPPEHKWSALDIQLVRTKLASLCDKSKPTFTDPLIKWSTAAVAELQIAIDTCECTSLATLRSTYTCHISESIPSSYWEIFALCNDLIVASYRVFCVLAGSFSGSRTLDTVELNPEDTWTVQVVSNGVPSGSFLSASLELIPLT